MARVHLCRAATGTAHTFQLTATLAACTAHEHTCLENGASLQAASPSAAQHAATAPCSCRSCGASCEKSCSRSPPCCSAWSCITQQLMTDHTKAVNSLYCALQGSVQARLSTGSSA